MRWSVVLVLWLVSRLFVYAVGITLVEGTERLFLILAIFFGVMVAIYH